MPLHSACRPSWVRPPPYNRPGLAPPSVISGLTAAVPKKPIDSEPIHPPTKCTPTTSSESSKPNRYLRLTASAHTAPATRPRITAANGAMYPQAGVIATSPATAPDEAPTIVGRPLIHSTITQPSSAAAMKPPPQIQCATGTYTSVNQPNANSTQPPNLARSEIAPLISATVMIANIIWNARIT